MKGALKKLKSLSDHKKEITEKYGKEENPDKKLGHLINQLAQARYDLEQANVGYAQLIVTNSELANLNMDAIGKLIDEGPKKEPVILMEDMTVEQINHRLWEIYHLVEAQPPYTEEFIALGKRKAELMIQREKKLK